MLALMSKGFSSNVLYKEKIYEEMVHLMEMASIPVLTDVALMMQVAGCELYPFPIPDLFVGAPLVWCTCHSPFNDQVKR